jgi:tetratricopeptide (TPR) repeat protein
VNKGLRNPADYQARESFLRSAVELDPDFAVAWGELAEAHVGIRAASIDTTPARLGKAKAAIERARALAPDSPSVIRSLGAYYAFGGVDSAKAIAQFEKPVRLQPNDAESHHWLGMSQFAKGQYAEGIVHRRQAAILDPAVW